MLIFLADRTIPLTLRSTLTLRRKSLDHLANQSTRTYSTNECSHLNHIDCLDILFYTASYSDQGKMPHALSMPSPGFQAVILCGPGVSLTTFTANPEDFPKALVPIANRPMIWYPLDWCYRMGITSKRMFGTVVCLHAFLLVFFIASPKSLIRLLCCAVAASSISRVNLSRW